MDFLRNKEVRLQIIIYSAINLLGSITALFICRTIFWIPLVIGFMICAISLLFTYRRYQRLSALSQDIDRLLHGEDNICFDDYDEGELAVLKNEISKMTLRLLEQSEQLREDKDYLEDALADISHQLKTPLTSLEIINAALLQENIDEEQHTALLQEQLMLLSRMEWLIAVLLKLSRLDAGTITFENQIFSVKELIKQATAAFEVTLDVKDITLNISVLSDVQLCGDIKWLAEALSNVIKNCIESTPSGGQITIYAEENSMYIKICIMDTGNGILSEDIPHLFERFYRGKNSGKNGVGIGLSLAKAIITQQNGTITVENQIPHGAKFTICFYKGIA